MWAAVVTSGAPRPLASPVMRCRGRRLSGFSGLMFAFGLAGLLVMHGFDAGAAAGGGDGHAVSAAVQHDMAPAAGVSRMDGAMPDAADSDRAVSTGDAGHMRLAAVDTAAGHAGLGHVMAMCMVVAAAASTGAVRRILGGVQARFAAAAARAAGRLAQVVEVGRPPGPGRLELCILRC
jgi:hypothetical protein